MGSIITLTTDFGNDDAYVAVMKGMILSINPAAVIIDICHTIEPQNIVQASFVISTACEYFPEGTIHLAVVDPGVGSQRRTIILKTPGAFYVAPDNGILSHTFGTQDQPAVHTKERSPKAELRILPANIQAVTLTNPRYRHHPVSSTFHGRDIFAPAAAHLSLGVPLMEFGNSIDSILSFPLSRPLKEKEGELEGHILYIDRFGNLITDIKEADVTGSRISVEISGRIITGLSTSYAEEDELLAIIGSSGHLEIALKNGSAARSLGAKIGDIVRMVSR